MGSPRWVVGGGEEQAVRRGHEDSFPCVADGRPGAASRGMSAKRSLTLPSRLRPMVVAERQEVHHCRLESGAAPVHSDSNHPQARDTGCCPTPTCFPHAVRPPRSLHVIAALCCCGRCICQDGNLLGEPYHPPWAVQSAFSAPKAPHFPVEEGGGGGD